MITRINEFQAARHKEEELHSFLHSLIPVISGSKGCISCQVLQSLESHDKFVVIEQWESVDAHKRAIESIPKEEIATAMSLFGAIPKGSYYK